MLIGNVQVLKFTNPVAGLVDSTTPSVKRWGEGRYPLTLPRETSLGRGGQAITNSLAILAGVQLMFIEKLNMR